MSGETGLMSTVLEDGRYHLRQYGHLVSEALDENNKENICMAALFASNYWRIIGKPHEAIDCQKKALHLAPTIWKFSALLSMANVLHRSHHSEDAVTILKNAIDITPDNPALHFTLGNIQATLLNFNESAESFRMAINLQSNFEAAKKRRHAVVCHQKIERALEEQQHALQETLNELRHYKRQHDKWTQLLNTIIDEQASLETRMQTTVGYEHLKLRIQMSDYEKRRRSKLHKHGVNGSKRTGNHQENCAKRIDEDGNMYLMCSVTSSDAEETESQLKVFEETNKKVSENNLRGHESKDIDKNSDSNDVDLLLKKFETRISEILEAPLNNTNNLVKDKRVHDKGANEKLKNNEEKSLREDYSIKPTLPERYPSYPDNIDSDSEEDMFWFLKTKFGKHWPSKETCNNQNLIREWSEFPTVFLSPENKGFE